MKENKKRRCPRKLKKSIIKKHGRPEYLYQYEILNYPGLNWFANNVKNKFSLW